MNPVAMPAPREPATSPVDAAGVLAFPAPANPLVEHGDPEGPCAEPPELAPPTTGVGPNAGGVFFVPDENNATGAESATGERCTSVENTSAVDKVAPVVEIAAVAEESSVENSTTVAELATVESESTVENGDRGAFFSSVTPNPVEQNATVEEVTTGTSSSTGALSSSTKDHRISKPRPILRVTDGLTPGQYAVYSLMFEAGEGNGGNSRIYKGGYADLGRLTGLSKRGIQNIVAELQAKQVIRIHQQPGYHRTETSAYLVPDADSVVRAWFANGWRHALGKSKTLVP